LNQHLLNYFLTQEKEPGKRGNVQYPRTEKQKIGKVELLFIFIFYVLLLFFIVVFFVFYFLCSCAFKIRVRLVIIAWETDFVPA